MPSRSTVGRFSDYLLNSILLSVPSTIAVVAVSTMAGYAFARLPFPGRTVVFYAVVLGLLVPFFTYMIPLYFQLRSMGLLDTLLGANLVLAATNISFGTFFMRAFFLLMFILLMMILFLFFFLHFLFDGLSRETWQRLVLTTSLRGVRLLSLDNAIRIDGG